MTPVGHSLVGASIGVISMPPLKSLRARLAFVFAFAALANVPDLAIPGWGHDRYDVSHSLWVNLTLIAAVAVVLRSSLYTMGKLSRIPDRENGTVSSPNAAISTVVILAGSMAWLSHLLLDSFYCHGNGIAIFWPFSNAHLALPIPWFDNLSASPPPLTIHTLRVCTIELLFYFPLLLTTLFCRRVLRSRTHRPECV
jgi:hypothetical protein